MMILLSLVCLLLLSDRTHSYGLRPQGLRYLQDENDDLKNSIVEEALMFLEENMSIDTSEPTKSPGMSVMGKFETVSVDFVLMLVCWHAMLGDFGTE